MSAPIRSEPLKSIRSDLRRNCKMFLFGAVLFLTSNACAERIKDIANIAGVRDNQLAGYGLVVGLDGTGDQTTQTPFTVQSIVNMLGNMGVTMPPGTNLQLKNVAAVMVTADLPAFAQPGQRIDITISSIGNAKSLKGGALVMTPLKGADGQIYAIAQGNMVVGGVAANGPGGGTQTINHQLAGRIPGGATVERAVPTTLGERGTITLELKDTNFTNARRVVDAINTMTPGRATALDGRNIVVIAPLDRTARVAFLDQIENLDVKTAAPVAKVIVNSRTGSVVMNRAVQLDNCAIAYGSLTVTVTAATDVSQPEAGSGGSTVVSRSGLVNIDEKGGTIMEMRGGASLSEVVKALNALGAKPLDLVSILQAMKASGALKAELEII